jgi:hypothetical protein
VSFAEFQTSKRTAASKPGAALRGNTIKRRNTSQFWIGLATGACLSQSIGLIACLGKGRGRDLNNQKAPIFQLFSHLRGLHPVRDDDHAGLAGSLRMSVQYGQAHRRMLPSQPLKTACTTAIDRNKLRAHLAGQSFGTSPGAAASKYPQLWFLCELVECTTVTFDNAPTYLVQIDILQDHRTTISTLKSERSTGRDRSSADDFQNYAPSSPSQCPWNDFQASHNGSPALVLLGVSDPRVSTRLAAARPIANCVVMSLRQCPTRRDCEAGRG